MRLLVTGGAGYIGSVTAEALLEAGHVVVIYDNLSTGHRAAVPDGAVFLEGDLQSEKKLETILTENAIDAVFHFAGRSLVGESMDQPGRYLRENVLGGLALLEAMVKASVHRLVYSSSCAIFGIPSRLPIEEDDPKEPISPYGDSKLLVERALRWYEERHRIRSISLRYFNAAGATARLGEAHRPETHLIPLLLQAAAGQRGAIEIYGTDYPTPDGTCIRDYVHVRDLAEAHLLALERLEHGLTKAYNLGSERGYSVREVIEVAEAVTPVGAAGGVQVPPDGVTDLQVEGAAAQASLPEGWATS